MPNACTDLKTRVDALYLEYIFPVLATVRVGEDPTALELEAALVRGAKESGVRLRRYMVPADTPEAEIARLLRETNADFLLSAVLLLSPLPAGWDEAALQALIAPEKRLRLPADCAPEAAACRLLEQTADAAERKAR